MSGNAWVTRDDVLNDLKEVNGRNTGAEYLEQYVVRGEAPPPVRQELTDDDEIQYRFGGPGPAGQDFTPDLKGISLMLQMVDDLDPVDSGESENKTIFRNTTTDEICISKLNAQVNEFVPGRRNTFKLEQKPQASKKVQEVQLETQSKFDKKGPVLVRKSDKINISKERVYENDHRTKDNEELSNEKTSNIRDEPNALKKVQVVQLETQSKFDKKGPVLVRKSDKVNISKERLNENGQRTKDDKELSNEKTSTITTSTSNIRDEPNASKKVQVVQLETQSNFDKKGPALVRKSDQVNISKERLNENGHRTKDNEEFSNNKTSAITTSTSNIRDEPNASKKVQVVQLETQSKFDIKGPVLITKSDKLNISKERLNENGHRTKDNDEFSNNKTSTITTSTSNIRDEPNGKVAVESRSHSSTSINFQTKPALVKIEDISLGIKKIKCDDIAEMKEKIKSKIISSSQHDSLQHRREKNVAIATLLKLCSAPRIPDDETSVKLVTPDYFKVPPIPEKVDDSKKSTINDKAFDVFNKEIDQKPDTSSSANPKYVDPLVQESISKVNEWFSNTGSPKPKPQAFDPVKEPSVFKKKTTSSPSVRSTPKSEVSSEKKYCGNFVPSSYANDLLQKYETNAKKKNIVPKEDLGTMLERQLKERDELIKKKLLEQNNAASEGSGRSVN